MSEQIKTSATFSVSPKLIYDAWLNGKEHAAMTGSKASASTKVGGRFTAWDGYIAGKNRDLVTNKRILQSWRSTDFPKDQLDSFLLIKLETIKGGTKVTLIHSEIPAEQGTGYKKGWLDFYFKPMQNYFDKNSK